MLTADTLAQIMGNHSDVDYNSLFPAFNAAMIQAGCTNVNRAAAWISQLEVESGGLRWMEELASGAEYEGRCIDLGNCQPGDGPRFKGRGPIQVTGRAHYQELSEWAAQQGYVSDPNYFVNNPDALANTTYGFLGAVWYWTVARPHINEQADAGDIAGVSYAVNGGDHGLDERIAVFNEARGLGDEILPDPSVTIGNIPVRPDFTEINVIGTRQISNQCQDRSGTTIDLLLGHTVEGELDGEDLIAFMETKSERSYHYIISLDGSTVWDLVDTDRAAWAVLSANNRSINYVIGRSYAGWSRQQWLDNARNAIRVMAYLMVQDSRKYGVDPRVLAPPYSSDPPGISDHHYVTVWLGDGTHTDLGPDFPWDTLESDINYFLHGEDDPLSGVNVEGLNQVIDKILAYPNDENIGGWWPSLAWTRDSDDEKIGDTVALIRLIMSTNWDQSVAQFAKDGAPLFVGKIERLAAGDGPEGKNPDAVAWAKAILAQVPESARGVYKPGSK